jgi:hypothetical protein
MSPRYCKKTPSAPKLSVQKPPFLLTFFLLGLEYGLTLQAYSDIIHDKFDKKKE